MSGGYYLLDLAGLENRSQVGGIGAEIFFYTPGLFGIPGAFDYQPAAPTHFVQGLLYFGHVQADIMLQPNAIFVGAMNLTDTLFAQYF